MLDEIYAFKFLRLLTQPWTSTKAFKLGLIDQNGKRTNVPINSAEQQSAYNQFTILVFNLKKLLEKVPFGKTSIAKYATALWLLKEHTGIDFQKQFSTYLNENNIESYKSSLEPSDKYIRIFECNFKLEDDNLILVEDTLTSGIDFADKKLFQKDEEHSPDEFYCGDPVFHCDSDSYFKSLNGKKPYARYKTYVGEDSTGNKIKNYSKSNPKKSIILKDRSTGAMIFFRKKK